MLKPLIDYIRDARAELGVIAAQIVKGIGMKNMFSHWFSQSQWQLPSQANHLKLLALLPVIAIAHHQSGTL